MERVKTVTVNQGYSPAAGTETTVVVSMYRADNYARAEHNGVIFNRPDGTYNYTVIAYDPDDMTAMAHNTDIRNLDAANDRFDRLVKLFTI